VVPAVRAVYPGRIWVDGNGSWSLAEALAAAHVFRDAGVELLEQPIPAGRLDDLETLSASSPVPILADEDCRGPADVLDLKGRVDGINIKLSKCGGIARARQMIHRARAVGLKVMLGCRTESVLGVTAMAQLAPLADYLDLDGNLDIQNDPFKGLGFTKGRISIPEAPGLGVVFNDQEER
jgi:L-alanine-DL-glutamate epimerase-like enolase superfamily enzyme